MLGASERADQLLDEGDRVALVCQSAREGERSLGPCRRVGRSAPAPVSEARRTRLSSIHWAPPGPPAMQEPSWCLVCKTARWVPDSSRHIDRVVLRAIGRSDPCGAKKRND
jgi:hypothetical protein